MADREEIAYLSDIVDPAVIPQGAVTGDLVSFGESGGKKVLADSGSKPSDFASSTALSNHVGNTVAHLSQTEHEKLTGIAEGAQVNVIESVSVNNSALPVSGKSVNIDLTGYYTKSEVNNMVYTKDQVDAKLPYQMKVPTPVWEDWTEATGDAFWTCTMEDRTAARLELGDEMVQLVGWYLDPSSPYSEIDGYDFSGSDADIRFVDGSWRVYVNEWLFYILSVLNMTGGSVTRLQYGDGDVIFTRVGTDLVPYPEFIRLPQARSDGGARDFLLRLTVPEGFDPSYDHVPDFVPYDYDNLTGEGEDIVFETDDGNFPAIEEGTWLWSFTETAPHKFAVSRKPLKEATQGGGN